MKTVKIMLPLLAALMFGNGVVRAQNEAKHDKPAVEVVVFHGVKQCQTCQAIKKNSQEVAEELAADGKNVSYRVVDFSKPEGKDEAKKYEIAWTSLLLIRHDAGDKETVRNISKFAIENARTNTEKFRKQLAEDIGKLLKESARAMEQFVNSLLDNCNLPVLTAFLLGILTSVSPCTFTTNVMVLGYIGRDMSGGRRVFANGLFYTLGRIVSYTVLGLICIPVLKKGASTFFVQSLVSDYGGYILAPTLIVYGVFLLLGSKFPFGKFGFRASESSKRLRGSFGAFVLGLLFALAFCPISGVFYFGMLLPMAALEPGGYLYPVVFAVASGILVVLIAWIVAFGMSSLGRFYNRVNQFQKWLNLIVAVAFILAGIYYFVIYYI